jgi:hypothetical protein
MTYGAAMVIEHICKFCSGKNENVVYVKQKDGSYMAKESSCHSNGDNPEEHFESIAFLLQQFIRCKADGIFDIHVPFKKGECEGCEYEREEIMNMIWHYGQLTLEKGKKSNE